MFLQRFSQCVHMHLCIFLTRLSLLNADEQNDIYSFTVGVYLQTRETILSFFPLPSCLFALPCSTYVSGLVQLWSNICPCRPQPKLPLDCTASPADPSSVSGSSSCYPRFWLSRLEETFSETTSAFRTLSHVLIYYLSYFRFREEETRNHQVDYSF